MKSLSCWRFATVGSFGFVAAGLARSRLQFPWGQLSFGSTGFVTPISFARASAANANRVGCCAFQPNLPTRAWPETGSRTSLGRPAMVGLNIAWAWAMSRNT